MATRDERRALRRAQFQRFLQETAQPESTAWAPPEPEPSKVSRVVPALVRGAGMMVGFAPGVGALAGGGSEALAEVLEGRFSPAEIAAATASGAVGGAAVRSIGRNIGKPLLAGIKGAGWGAAQPIVRSAIDPNYDLTPEDVALSSAVGGGFAGGFAKLMRLLAGPELPAQAGKLFEVETTARPGGSVFGGGKVTAKKGGKTTLTGAELTPVRAPSAIMEAAEPRWKVPSAAQPAEDVAAAGVPIRAPETTMTPAQAKAQANADALASIEQRRAGAGVVAQPPTYAETVSAVTPEGTRVSEATKYLDEEASKTAELAQVLGLTARQARNIPPAGPARDVYISLREAGMPHASALKRAAKGHIPPKLGIPTPTPGRRVVIEEPVMPPVEPPPVPAQVTGLESLFKQDKVLTPKQEAQERSFRELQERLFGEGKVPTTAVEPTPALPGTMEAIAERNPATLLPTGVGGHAAEEAATALEARRAAELAELGHPVEAPVAQPATPSFGKAAGVGGLGDLLKVYRTKAGVAGQNYRFAKEAAEKGEIPSAQYAREALIREQAAARAAGQPLGRARMPQEAQAPVSPTPGIPTATAPPTGARGKAEELLKLQGWSDEEIAQYFADAMPPRSSETGAIDPALLASLGLGAAGALVGGATDPFDNPILSAAAGGLAGATAPSLVSAASRLVQRTAADPSLPPSIKNVIQSLAGGDKEKVASTLWSEIPDYLRASLLYSPNIFSNMWAGPWGAGMAAGLEHYMAGSPVGNAILHQMTPANWTKEFHNAVPEAQRIIHDAIAVAAERAEGVPGGSNLFARFMQGPAVGMMAGDIATRNILQKAGLSEELARKYTLTSEPAIKELEALVRFQRSGPLGRLLMPFAKTLTNITEQSAARTPIIGKWIQSRYPGLAYAPEIQAQQQVLGAAVPTAAGAVGYFGAPEEDNIVSNLGGKALRGFVSNVAGPYSGLASVGYGVGRALKAKQNAGIGDVVGRAGSEALQTIPLPSTDVPQSYWNALRDLLNGEPKTIPSGAIPGAGVINIHLRDIAQHGRKSRSDRPKREGR